MKLWRILTSLVIVSLLLTVTLTSGFVLAGKPDKEPPPPADPAIAYVAPKGRSWNLMVMNADGSNQASLYSERNQLGKPTWAPDGSAIAFLHGSISAQDLMRIDVSIVDGEPQGSNPMELVQDVHGQPAWSPQGDIIAFRQRDGESRLIQTVPATGGEVETIYTAPEGYGIGDVTWRSDGSKLAFSMRDNDYLTSIVVLDISDGSTTVVYGPTTGQFSNLDWARTKNAFVFTCNPPAGNICILDLTNPSATPETVIGDGSKMPSWSPDDSQIIFQKWDKNNWVNLRIYTLDTGETEAPAKGVKPDWGRHVSS